MRRFKKSEVNREANYWRLLIWNNVWCVANRIDDWITISFLRVANLKSKDDSPASEFLLKACFWFWLATSMVGVVVIWKPPFLSIDIDITKEGGNFWWIQLLSTSWCSSLLEDPDWKCNSILEIFSSTDFKSESYSPVAKIPFVLKLLRRPKPLEQLRETLDFLWGLKNFERLSEHWKQHSLVKTIQNFPMND